MKHYLKFGLLLAIASLIESSSAMSAASPRTDKLPSADWWRSKVQEQVRATHNREYSGCIFGDSISSGLGNSLGQSTFNFAMGGLSSVSLLEQLKQLRAGNVQCDRVVIAIGTNDAMYVINDNEFKHNLRKIIFMVRSMGATEVVMLPAFYSTVEASQDPNAAGTIERVEEISALIQQVAAEQQANLVVSDLQPLFRNRSLRADLTFDGVHLNDSGKKIYRQVLIKLLSPTVGSR